MVLFIFPLREKCSNKAFFLVRIFRYLDWIRRFTKYLSVFSPNTGKYGPEKTPYLNTFHTVFHAFIFDLNSSKELALHKMMKFSIKDFISKYDQIRSFLPSWSHILNKYLMENIFFCVVLQIYTQMLVLPK